MIDLGTPSKSSERQKNIQNRSSGAKKAKLFLSQSHFGGVLEPTLFPNRFRLMFSDLGKIYDRFMIDVGSFVCNLVRFVEGFVIVVGSFFKHISATVLLKYTADEHQVPPRSAKINQTIAKHKPPNARCRNESRKNEF